MNTWLIYIPQQAYNYSISGKKNIEIVANNPHSFAENFFNAKIKDTIILYTKNKNSYPSSVFSITDIHKYSKENFKSFNELIKDVFNKEGIENVFPYVNSLEEAIRIYYKFRGYKDFAKKAIKYGVCAFHFKQQLNF